MKLRTEHKVMHPRFEQQFSFGIVPIADTEICLKSRHELPAILMGLKHIFIDTGLNEAAMRIMEESFCGDGKQKTGRRGMQLWQTLVLSVVKLGTDSNWDELLHNANNDMMLRGILGVATTGFFPGRKVFAYQTVRDNVSKLDGEAINRIGALVVAEGHCILKKKGDQGLEVKVDTFPVESDIHWPTDSSLALDAMRKCLKTMLYLGKRFHIPGWRKAMWWFGEAKAAERAVSRAWGSRAADKWRGVAEAAGRFLQLAIAVQERVEAVLPLLKELFATNKVSRKHRLIAAQHWFLVRQIDLFARRSVDGETIPQCEKLFSLFEPLAEWISKGKAGKKVEFGHNVLVVTDQHGFMLHHEVVMNTADVDLALPLARRLRKMYGKLIVSISFDRGFYSKENKAWIKKLFPFVVMPKKGKLNDAEREEESGGRFKALRKRHSGVESNINQLEHNGLGKCRDKGIEAFVRHAALGALSFNLHRLGTALLNAERKKRREEERKRLRAALRKAA